MKNMTRMPLGGDDDHARAAVHLSRRQVQRDVAALPSDADVV